MRWSIKETLEVNTRTDIKLVENKSVLIKSPFNSLGLVSARVF